MSDRIVAHYLTHQQVRGFSDNTWRRREWALQTWTGFLQPRGLGDATADDVESFLAGYPNTTTRYHLFSDLKMFYRFACRRGLLDVDPTGVLDAPRKAKRLPTPVPAGEVRRLLDELVDPVDRLLVMLPAFAGLRVSEVANLQGEDVDLEHRRLTVRQGKGGKDAVVPLAAPLAAELTHGTRVPCGPVVPQRDGGAVGDRIRILFRRHGIVGYRPHDLRATFATEAMERSNGNVVLVQKLLRHEAIASTMLYVKVDRTGADLVDQLYGEATR